MSSLAASRADNFYFPPDWRPEYGGISKFQGSTGANQYEKYGIIRFELPFDGWCTQCKRHISKGTRFNAKKDKVGKYYTTTLWAFTMKCASCDQQIVIKTDPENATYDFAEGIKKMEQDFIPDFDDSIIQAVTDETRHELATNPMFRLQHDQEDRVRASSTKERLANLIEIRDMVAKEDYDMNGLLRSKNRKRRRHESAMKEEGRKRGLNIPVLDCNEADLEAAKGQRFKTQGFEVNKRGTLALVQAQSIFPHLSDAASTFSYAGHGDRGLKLKQPSRMLPSAAAKKQERLHAAMHKQATLRINSTKWKAGAHSDISLSDSLHTGKDMLLTFTPVAASTKNSIQSSSSTKNVVTSALGMICSYGEEDD